MLHENIIVDHVCDHLSRLDWTVESRCHERQRGDDIVAHRGPLRLRVEAKGEGSADPSSNRAGLAFSRGQVIDHVGKAFYRAAAIRDQGDQAAMAFPDNANHREAVSRITASISDLGITVFWVDPAGTVTQSNG